MPTKVGAVVLRVLLAAVFLLSAVAKLMAIDDFELYVFSYGLFSLNTTYVLVRLCIGAELALALLVALGCWRRWVNLAVMGVLLFFSLFLCYAALSGREESCQCFGRLAEMPPAASLLKNAVLMLLTLLYMKVGGVGSGRRWHRIVTPLVLLAAMAVPFAVSVPDNWMFGPEEARFGREAFDKAIAPDGDLAEYGLQEGRHLVAFVTPGCPYCRMTRQKLDSIAERHGIEKGRMLFLEPEAMGVALFMEITHGKRPLVMLVDHGQVTTTYHYRNIDERQVSEFLHKPVDK